MLPVAVAGRHCFDGAACAGRFSAPTSSGGSRFEGRPGLPQELSVAAAVATLMTGAIASVLAVVTDDGDATAAAAALVSEEGVADAADAAGAQLTLINLRRKDGMNKRRSLWKTESSDDC